MPRASINVEFEDGDLRKFAEDMLRRWTLNTIHDLLKHIRDPHLSHLIKQAIQMGMSAGYDFKRGPDRRPHQRPADAPPGPPPWGPGEVHDMGMVGEILRRETSGAGRMPPQEGKLTRCMPIEANPYQEEGWMCHGCSTYNGVQRSVCRQCDHERCDDVVPSTPSPGGGSVPSGSA